MVRCSRIAARHILVDMQHFFELMYPNNKFVIPDGDVSHIDGDVDNAVGKLLRKDSHEFCEGRQAAKESNPQSGKSAVWYGGYLAGVNARVREEIDGKPEPIFCI